MNCSATLRLAAVCGCLAAAAPAAAQTCDLDTTPEYQRMGGSATLGPYASAPACETVRADSFGVNGRCRCSAAPPSNASTVRFQLPPARQAVVDAAVLAYVKTAALGNRVQQSPAGDSTKLDLKDRFLDIDRRFAGIRDRWLAQLQQGRQLTAETALAGSRIAAEEANLRAQTPGPGASPAQVAAFDAMVDRFNVRIDAQNATTKRRGDAFVAAGTTLAAEFERWKDDPRLRDFTRDAQAVLAANAPNLDPGVVDARNVKPFAPGERERELARPGPSRSLRTTAPPPPSSPAARAVLNVPLSIAEGKTLRSELQDAYERYATGSTAEEKLKARAALDGARQLALDDLRARLAHHDAVKAMLARGRETLSPAERAALNAAAEARRAAEFEVDEMLQKGLRAADARDLDFLVEAPPRRLWPGPANPTGPLVNPLVEAGRREELVNAVLDRRRRQEALAEIFSGSDAVLMQWIRDTKDWGPSGGGR